MLIENARRRAGCLAVIMALPVMIGAAGAAELSGAAATQPADRLDRVIILMRHGVRSAMSTPEQLGRYSVRPWPKFSVPPGHLTPRGALLVEHLGRYYRAHYRDLLSKDDCEAAYFWANRTQRTEATARAFAAGLLPECKPVVHTTTDAVDPLFDAHAAGVGKPDYTKVQAAILGRMGGDPVAWSAAQSADVSLLDALLLQLSLRQLREASELTETAPPLSAPIFVPGCSEPDAGFDCPIEQFTALVEGYIDPQFVPTSPARE